MLSQLKVRKFTLLRHTLQMSFVYQYMHVMYGHRLLIGTGGWTGEISHLRQSSGATSPGVQHHRILMTLL